MSVLGQDCDLVPVYERFCSSRFVNELRNDAAGLPANINVQAEEGTDINVSAQVEVFPEIEIKDYTGIEIEMKIEQM